LLPLHAPLAVQAVALAEDQVSVALCPAEIVVGATAIVTVGAGGFTMSVAVPFADLPAPEHISV
jgi:hypothetical protein